MVKATFLLVVWSLVLVAASSEEDPGACLLQQGSSHLQKAVLNEIRRKPDKEEKESASNEESSNEEPEEGDEKSISEKKDEKGDDKGEKDEDVGKSDSGRRRRRKSDEEERPSAVESLRLELNVAVPIKELKGSKKGPLTKFTDRLKKALAKAADIPAKRLDVLGVREAGVSLLQDPEASLLDSQAKSVEAGSDHSIVDVEVLPGNKAKKDKSPKEVFKEIKEQLKRKGSPLMKGEMKAELKGAEVSVHSGVEGLSGHDSGSRHPGERLLLPAIIALFCLPLTL
jgi:hypothetical protein